MRLPFENKRSDIGEWTYDHRVGLCITLIAYLVLAIAFVAGKIVVGEKPHSQGIYIDIKTLAELEMEKNRLEQEVARKKSDDVDWKKIQNLVSNENAESDKANKGQKSDMSSSDKALQDRMRANRDAYEKGLAEEQAIRNNRGGDNAKEAQDAKIKGRVTVSFSLVNPVRNSRHLEVPAYQCEGGGEVVVEITVDRSGDVVNARVASGGDDCMRDTALRAARNSRFNIDDSAPARQTGTITYIFIPQ